MPADRIFISAEQVADLLELPDVAHFRRRRERLEETGFPPPVAWARRPLRWRRADVIAWLEFGQYQPPAETPAGMKGAQIVMLAEARRA